VLKPVHLAGKIKSLCYPPKELPKIGPPPRFKRKKVKPANLNPFKNTLYRKKGNQFINKESI